MTDRFELGKTSATAGAMAALGPEEVYGLLRRHAAGDWGIVNADDRRENEAALRDGERVFSAYEIGATTVYVITEWDRSLTTVLLASEY